MDYQTNRDHPGPGRLNGGRMILNIDE